ncbi:type III-B CRISPR module-associated protein Cmr3, partial [Akkermansiaceae bacterium]|nr:type III-B CRISPR module-associated protein Cmr3 [Akkermansiaceae bacterium]
MNTLLLQPTDVLFFRDGRPMSGSLSGHGAAWPLPTVTNAALHAALHRVGIEESHTHCRGRSGTYTENRDRKFGSLVTAGPFPVKSSTWLFPRPLDAGDPSSITPSLLPLEKDFPRNSSSLPKPLKYAVANTKTATKDTPAPWWTAAAWQSYLDPSGQPAPEDYFHLDSDFCDTESTFGIGIDPVTGTQDGERFYSAHYLRLRDECRIGLLAEAQDKIDNSKENKRDLIAALFPNRCTETPIIIGGQQRVCSVKREHPDVLPLPSGAAITGTRVKWVLLTPAIFPAINAHPGGWLPSWIDGDGHVQLLDGPGKGYARRHKVAQGKRISATLVAA